MTDIHQSHTTESNKVVWLFSTWLCDKEINNLIFVGSPKVVMLVEMVPNLMPVKAAGSSISKSLAIVAGKVAAKRSYVKDFATGKTKNFSAFFKSEREARNLARTKLGKNAIEIEPNKWRSVDGKWQYRAKPGDFYNKHIHLEEININTGEVIQNFHLRWR